MYKAKKLPFLYYQLEPTVSTKTNAIIMIDTIKPI